MPTEVADKNQEDIIKNEYLNTCSSNNACNSTEMLKRDIVFNTMPKSDMVGNVPVTSAAL